MIRIITLIFAIFSLSSCGNYANDYIDADDNGQGKSVRLIVKPDERNGMIIKDENNNIAPKWFDTGLIVSNFFDKDTLPGVGLSIRGRWYPFGSVGDNKECTAVSCSGSGDVRCNQLPSDTPVVSISDDNIGCYLSQGKGIYILVAKQDGVNPDPNLNPTVANSPSSSAGFYTAHIGDFQANKEGLINIDKLWSCNDDASTVACTPIPIQNLVGGKVYLKAFDGYYGDNSADMKDMDNNPYVGINIKKGVLYPNFVSESIKILVSTIDSVSQRIRNSLIDNLRQTAFVIVLMYLAFTGFFFMIGLAKINQTEAVVRLTKVGIVLMFLTPNNIIVEGFSKMYQGLANVSSNIIIQNLSSGNTVIAKPDPNNSDLENNLNYLRMYDKIVNQILSRQVHIKLIALLFTLNFWLIPLMYILIVMILFIVLRSLMLYIAAYLQIAFLILILPILVPTILFQTTADLFQNWLKYMANSALLIVVATTGFGVVLGIMLSNFGNMLSYSVTKTWWWFPDNNDAVSAVLNFTTYVKSLIKALICYAFIEVAPKLSDALSESQLSPSLNAFNSLWKGMSDMMNEGLSGLKSFNNQYLMGRLMDQSYKTDGKYDRAKEGKGAANWWRQTRQDIGNSYKVYQKNKLTKFIGDSIIRPIYNEVKDLKNDDSIFRLNDPYKDQLKKEELADLREKNERNHTTYSDYKDMINTKKKEYLDQITSNSSLINQVTLDGIQAKLDADARNTIICNGQEVSKDEIRAAIAEGRDAKSVDGNNIAVEHDPQQGGYDSQLNDKLQSKLKELSKIEKDYGFSKRK